MTREEAKQKIYNASKEDRSSPKNCIHLLYLHGFIDQIFDEFGEQLKDKDYEIELLKSIVEEAIRKPMGIEPHSWSDYKIKKATT